jgi:GT2 family glycosyltransferase
MQTEVKWSVVIPTYRRQDVLVECLEHLVASDLPLAAAEVLIYDNGSPQCSADEANAFATRLPIRYTDNGGGNGLGFSLVRGANEARGRFVLEMNDDALIPADLFGRLDRLFESDARIGVIGVRAIERDYGRRGEGIGVLDAGSLEVVGNFDIETDGPVDVEHVYGFCYAYRRQVLERGGTHDTVLLSKDYSSGSRIETDHCLMAKRVGYRVIYDGRIGVLHLAKPRGDMSERSSRWRLNHIRNTLYLYLKHFGWFGRSGMGLRFCLLHDLGIVSFLKRPNRDTWSYFAISIRARLSGVGHWFRYILRGFFSSSSN